MVWIQPRGFLSPAINVGKGLVPIYTNVFQSILNTIIVRIFWEEGFRQNVDCTTVLNLWPEFV